MRVAGVWMETALLHWLLVSLPFLYAIDSHLKIITCVLHIGWNQWPWQWMEVTVGWSSLFHWLDTGESFIWQNAQLFPMPCTVRVKQRLKALLATGTYSFIAASNFSTSHSQKNPKYIKSQFRYLRYFWLILFLLLEKICYESLEIVLPKWILTYFK